MIDRKRIENLCNDTVPKSELSTRKGPGGRDLSYLDQSYIINRLNTVFGNLGWSSRTESLIVVAGPTEATNKDGVVNIYVTMQAQVTITIHLCDGTTLSAGHDDFGYGQGIARMTGDAFESAGKEAVTDALKRAARKFGKSLGLALYDKSKKDIGEAKYDEFGDPTILGALLEAIAAAETKEQLEEAGDMVAKAIEAKAIPGPEELRIRKVYKEKKNKLSLLAISKPVSDQPETLEINPNTDEDLDESVLNQTPVQIPIEKDLAPPAQSAQELESRIFWEGMDPATMDMILEVQARRANEKTPHTRAVMFPNFSKNKGKTVKDGRLEDILAYGVYLRNLILSPSHENYKMINIVTLIEVADIYDQRVNASNDHAARPVSNAA